MLASPDPEKKSSAIHCSVFASRNHAVLAVLAVEQNIPRAMEREGILGKKDHGYISLLSARNFKITDPRIVCLDDGMSDYY
jgi:hypothetical protein